MEQEIKRKRKLRNLRYLMRKKGYAIDNNVQVAVMPDDDSKRSHLQESRLQKFGYSIQYNMFNN